MITKKRSTNAEPAPKVSSTATEVPWNPWLGVVYAVVVVLAAQFVASLLVSIYPQLQGWTHQQASNWIQNSTLGQFVFVLLAEGITFGAIWQFLRVRRASLRLIGWQRIRWRDPVYMLAGFAGYFVLYLVVLSVVTYLFPSINVDQKQQLGFQTIGARSDLVWAFLSLVVLPPIVEETVFRGFIFTGLRSQLKPLWAAAITSVVFAAAHLEIGSGQPLLWAAAIDTFTLSMVLCYLRQETGSLWPGILLHGAKNTIAFITLYAVWLH